jgi:hypothetical protein
VRVPHTGEPLHPTVTEAVTTVTTVATVTDTPAATAGAAAAAIAGEDKVSEQLEAGLAVTDVTATTKTAESATDQQPSTVLNTDTTAGTAEHSSSSRSSNSEQQQQQQQLQLQLSPDRAAAVRHRDVYGDDTVLSRSPGFVSTFKESGRMGWHQVTDGVQVDVSHALYSLYIHTIISAVDTAVFASILCVISLHAVSTVLLCCMSQIAAAGSVHSSVVC